MGENLYSYATLNSLAHSVITLKCVFVCVFIDLKDGLSVSVQLCCLSDHALHSQCLMLRTH